MKTPILRFSTFVEKGGTWHPFKVEDLGKFLRGQTYSRNDVTGVCTDVLIIRSSNLQDAWYVDVSIDPQYVDIEVSDDQQLKKNDVVICTANGSTKLVGKASIYDGEYKGRISWGAFCAVFRPSIELSKYFFSTNQYKKLIDIHKQGGNGALANLNIQSISKEEIYFPVLEEEQQKIAAFFTALDEKIRLSEQKLNLISKIKKAIAQKLFAQDLRFKNEDGYFFDSWESYTVGELVDVIGGGTPSTQNPDYWDGDIYWLTPTEINSKYVHSSNRKITFDGVKNSSAKLLPKGALLLTTRATLGACSINNQDNPVCTNQGFQSLVCKDGVDNEFMYYVVTDSAFQKAMIQRASGSTFLEISSKNLKGILIHLPSLEEQRQIATLLSSLDKKIDCLKQRVKALKTQKASFMQQMFV